MTVRDDPKRPPLYFFLSYARSDDSELIRTFFNDLSAEVRSYAGVSPGVPVGFLDDETLNLGQYWSDELVSALLRTRTLIALASPRYLGSEPCGREWKVFADRVRAATARGQQAASAHMTLLWLPPPKLPRFVEETLYDGDLPPVYGRAGLRQLMRLQDHRDHYFRFIAELAQRIVHAAQNLDIPPGPSDLTFEQIPHAFARRNRTAPTRSPIRIIVAAPTRADLATRDLTAFRRDPRFYGPDATRWAPYQSTSQVPVADLARSLAQEYDFVVSVSAVDDGAARATMSVLLVDPWVALVAARRAALTASVEAQQRSVVGVFVLASDDDLETHRHLGSLLMSLRPALSTLSARPDVVFQEGVSTMEAFAESLRALLERKRVHPIRDAKAPRRRSNPGQRPIIQNP
ncbi:TIR-like protein FxsC [Luedemannella helvata]|uniref:TIR domain-containing protein n=1 Tax=Luedemannella helvata TaxID=349315 RepID=A0ABN2KE61_9ACTN